MSKDPYNSTTHTTEFLKEQRTWRDIFPRYTNGQQAWVKRLMSFSTVVVWPLSYVCLFVTPWTVTCQAPLSSTVSQSWLKLMSTESVMLSNHLILCCPMSFCLQSFPSSGSFPMSWLVASGGQSMGVSASVLQMNIQDSFPLGLTGLISLQSKRLSRIFFSATI